MQNLRVKPLHLASKAVILWENNLKYSHEDKTKINNNIDCLFNITEYMADYPTHKENDKELCKEMVQLIQPSDLVPSILSTEIIISMFMGSLSSKGI